MRAGAQTGSPLSPKRRPHDLSFGQVNYGINSPALVFQTSFTKPASVSQPRKARATPRWSHGPLDRPLNFGPGGVESHLHRHMDDVLLCRNKVSARRLGRRRSALQVFGDVVVFIFGRRSASVWTLS